ncbi:phosphoribosylformylglycinamidine synthase [Acetanaerobacterium elongatum]|uniref:Phosphoribosylformylglycinamidine synthase n=1 Tax=Acetanaerobacterium elongatum TaxID=258515 RepID=A0A1G9WZ83_9FIRM|nr:phosphoribosylformylglycinamidine synthase [Acetanaerobacterium elongatum]SDM89747.1 phosphoribosylformylglycinamidine synthase [Acetanaerobacterium elongatum]
MKVFRVYVEKKNEFAVEAKGILGDIHSTLNIQSLKGVRVINRYDAQGLSESDFAAAKRSIFSEPQVDNVYDKLPALNADERIFAVEFLPGQFDQRADSCGQCISLMTQKARPLIKSARVFILKGAVTDAEFETIKGYLINPVESREATLASFDTLEMKQPVPEPVATLDGFIDYTEEQLGGFIVSMGLAMDLDDIKFCQDYFKNTEKRNPTVTEIRMIDTYWSDHCRHTTFLTEIESADIASDYIQDAYNDYLNCRKELYAGKNKPQTLMDIAVIGAKYLKKNGLLPNLDESDEINACTVKIKVDVDNKEEDWLLLFKNETHNHPTEIEPFGGAATCLGGAIRDPLSGRAYVYQAMRVTGAANPLTPFEKTLKGKLPQKKLVTTAANGYSSYGNQIGLATGHVKEFYHPGYVAKRLEIGAVVGAAKAENVILECPEPGDVVVLLGGKTGRDGCGGATGSSKSHTLASLESCGAEVQKGNAPEERKLQRLFRNPEVTGLIRRCNDFGAGGVSVAIGELADGLKIYLDRVPKKYDGLNGTELAISESQERMACVVRKKDLERFIALADTENLEATYVADVTDTNRLVMELDGINIVNITRDFLNSNGASKKTAVKVNAPSFREKAADNKDFASRMEELVSDLNICSQKGLVERFDSTIGAASVILPYGGKTQLTETQAMAAKIPVLDGNTDTCSIMAYGFDPFISEQSPFHGAMTAIISSVAKVIAAGGSRKGCYLTLQEYFERTKGNPERWGKPFAALLGALKAQLELGIAAIGGKDSMSGSFEDIDVPPTLVSFAISCGKASTVVSTEFKQSGSHVALIQPKTLANRLPDFDSIKACFDQVEALISEGKVLSAWALSMGGIAEGIFKMGLGNQIGFSFTKEIDDEALFSGGYGGFLLELNSNVEELNIIGVTQSEYYIEYAGKKTAIMPLENLWKNKLESVFPCNVKGKEGPVEAFSYNTEKHASAAFTKPAADLPAYSYNALLRTAPKAKVAKPRVLIPVFPGTNCEYDTAKAFTLAGAEAECFVVRNLTPEAVAQSVESMAKAISNSQIIAIPGGFSGGDEPDGSAKFITAFFRNPQIKEAVRELIHQRDGLMIGICNGFQALIKLGLVPFGDIVDVDEVSPTLTYNTIGRHQSMMVRTRVASNLSPWLMYNKVGDVHTIAVSHGEGRFIISDELMTKLVQNGQIATQYVDLSGVPTMDIPFNPNGSAYAVEGITSPDGRIFGKMGHSERRGDNVIKNVPGEKNQKLFQAAVDYFAL